ncbi:MAG: hypothetical protein CBC29_07060 [Methylococcaceae bacterium TMED69]|nr:MAG: hypothetical protein CBC29_07060 [Methylococcaceae bacterium TMED69]
MGGCGKHMLHPYDNFDLTFDDLANLICKVGNADIEAIEKVDGVNLHWTIGIDGYPRFALNMTQMKSGGLSPVEFMKRMQNHPGSPQFVSGMQEINNRARILHNRREGPAMFWPFSRNLTKWVNTEVVSAENPQCFKYDKDSLVYHDLVEYDPVTKSPVSVLEDFSSPWQNFIKTEMSQPWRWNTHHRLPVTYSRNSRNIERTLSRLHSIMGFWKLRPETTLRDYYAEITKKELSQWLKRVEAKAVVENVWYGVSNNIRFIKKELPEWAPMDRFNRIALSKHRQGYWGECKGELASLFADFGSTVIYGVKSNLIEDSEAQTQRIKRQIDFNVEQAKIHAETNPEILEELEANLDKFERLGNKIPMMEGIVFTMDGNKYKLTGSFPFMNRICGAVRYSLGIQLPG